MALSRPAADQGIVHALVQATNSRAVISLLIDFEVGSEKKFRRKLLDCETDSVRSVRKTSVPNWLSPRLPFETRWPQFVPPESADQAIAKVLPFPAPTDCKSADECVPRDNCLKEVRATLEVDGIERKSKSPPNRTLFHF